MATDRTRNPRRIVDEGLQTLLDVLAPFVLDALSSAYGSSWWTRAVEPVIRAGERERTVDQSSPHNVFSDSQKISDLNLRELLVVIERSWVDVFSGRLARPARSYVGECKFIRDRFAHQRKAEPWTLDDAARAIGTMRRLAEKCAKSEPAGTRALEQLLREVEELRGVEQKEVASPLAERTTPDTRSATAAASESVGATTVQLPLRSAWGFAEAYGLHAASSRIRSAPVPGRVHPSVFRRALLAELFAEQGLLDQFIRERWPHGSTEGGQRLLESYRRLLERLRFRGDSDERAGWAAIESLIGTIEGPEDWSAEHDHYLYGIAKANPRGR